MQHQILLCVVPALLLGAHTHAAFQESHQQQGVLMFMRCELLGRREL